MKKFLVVLAVAALTATGAFAQAADNQIPQGTWTDTKYNADWTFQINTESDTICELRDRDSGELIYKFTKGNVQDFAITPSNDGISVSWKCRAKNREYKFTKPVNFDTGLQLEVHNTYYNEDHKAKIEYKLLNNQDNKSALGL